MVFHHKESKVVIHLIKQMVQFILKKQFYEAEETSIK